MKKKFEGFTLIELIVVIAILAIIAGILVPTMVVYVRNSKVSKANANAKQVNIAMTAALTEFASSQHSFSSSGSEDLVAISIREKSNGTADIPYTISGKYSGTDGYPLDFTAYLGDNFQGCGVGIVDPESITVRYSFWSENPNNEVPLTIKAKQGIYTEKSQHEDAVSGVIYGCYPLATS